MAERASGHMALGWARRSSVVVHPAHVAVAAGVDELAPAAPPAGQALVDAGRSRQTSKPSASGLGADRAGRFSAGLRNRGRHSGRPGARPGQRSASSGRKQGRDLSFMYQVLAAGKSRHGTSPK